MEGSESGHQGLLKHVSWGESFKASAWNVPDRQNEGTHSPNLHTRKQVVILIVHARMMIITTTWTWRVHLWESTRLLLVLFEIRENSQGVKGPMSCKCPFTDVFYQRVSVPDWTTIRGINKRKYVCFNFFGPSSLQLCKVSSNDVQILALPTDLILKVKQNLQHIHAEWQTVQMAADKHVEKENIFIAM